MIACLPVVEDQFHRESFKADDHLVTHNEFEMMCCLLVLDSVTSTPQWIRQPRPHVSLNEGTYHTSLFRGPSTNDMKNQII
jgi:hypothetical protein